MKRKGKKLTVILLAIMLIFAAFPATNTFAANKYVTFTPERHKPISKVEFVEQSDGKFKLKITAENLQSMYNKQCLRDITDTEYDFFDCWYIKIITNAAGTEIVKAETVNYNADTITYTTTNSFDSSTQYKIQMFPHFNEDYSNRGLLPATGYDDPTAAANRASIDITTPISYSYVSDMAITSVSHEADKQVPSSVDRMQYYPVLQVSTSYSRSDDYYVMAVDTNTDTVYNVSPYGNYFNYALPTSSQKYETGPTENDKCYFSYGTTYVFYLADRTSVENFESINSCVLKNTGYKGSSEFLQYVSKNGALSKPYEYTTPGTDNTSNLLQSTEISVTAGTAKATVDFERIGTHSDGIIIYDPTGGYGYEIYVDGNLAKTVSNCTTATVSIPYTGSHTITARMYYDQYSGCRLYGKMSDAATVSSKAITHGILYVTKISTSKVAITVSKQAEATGTQIYAYYSGKWRLIKTTTGTRYTYSKKNASKMKFKARGYIKSSGKTYYSSYTSTVKPGANVKTWAANKKKSAKSFNYMTGHYLPVKVWYSGSKLKVSGYLLNTRIFKLKKATITVKITNGGKTIAKQKFTKKIKISGYGKKLVTFTFKKATKGKDLRWGGTGYSTVTSAKW